METQVPNLVKLRPVRIPEAAIHDLDKYFLLVSNPAINSPPLRWN